MKQKGRSTVFSLLHIFRQKAELQDSKPKKNDVRQMFQRIEEFALKNFSLDDFQSSQLSKFCSSLESSLPKLERCFHEITTKYNFDTVQRYKEKRKYPTSNCLYIWREAFQFELSAALDDHKVDPDFIHFIYGNDVYNPLPDLGHHELEKFIFDVYYTWIAYAYYTTKSYSNGIPMGITVNGDISSYYFNDCSYQALSMYHNRIDTNKRLGSPYARHLGIEEILVRTHIVQKRFSEIELSCQKDKEEQILIWRKNSHSAERYNIHSGKLVGNMEISFEETGRKVQDQDTCVSHLARTFETLANQGWIFNLLKSRRR